MKLTHVLTPALALALGLWVVPVQADGDAAAAPAAPAATEKAQSRKANKGGRKNAAAAAPAGDAAAPDAAPAANGKGAGKGAAKADRQGKAGRRTQKTDAAATTTAAPVVGDAQARVDKRQDIQARRIDAGVKRGSLTADELTKLQAQQKSIADMENQFAGDGKLTRDEAGQLRQSLNDASLQIWTEKRDTDGKQQPVVRLGKDIFLNDTTAAKLQSADLTRQEARGFTRDFSRTLELRRKLASEDLPADQRTALQAEYNELLNKYFTARTPPGG
jgi:hypothetical protein